MNSPRICDGGGDGLNQKLYPSAAMHVTDSRVASRDLRPFNSLSTFLRRLSRGEWKGKGGDHMLDAVAWQSCFAFLCPSGLGMQLPLLQSKERQKGPGRKGEGWLATMGPLRRSGKKAHAAIDFRFARSLCLRGSIYDVQFRHIGNFPGAPFLFSNCSILYLYFLPILLRYVLCKTQQTHTHSNCISNCYIHSALLHYCTTV